MLDLDPRIRGDRGLPPSLRSNNALSFPRCIRREITSCLPIRRLTVVHVTRVGA